jgi:predicted SAM-dependent methyltransferase
MRSEDFNPRQLLFMSAIVLAGLLGLEVRALSQPVDALQGAAEDAARNYLATHAVRKLQIGAGGQNLPGWLNSDIAPRPGEIYLDATKRFPLPNESLNYIFSEHLFEHLTYAQGFDMLRECYRVLTPGGKLRIATPDLRKLIELFQEPKSDEMKAFIAGKLAWHRWPASAQPEVMILNMQLRDFGHQFVYDSTTLSARLMEAGFHTVREFKPGETDDLEFADVETRHRASMPHHWLNDYETMVLQAIK